MSTSTAKTPRAVPASATRRTGGESFIEQQLERTRRHVKRVELGAAMMQLAAGLLAALLMLAIVEHWVWSFGTLGRWVLFLSLVIASCVYAVHSILPLLWSSINPVYAAHTIEQADPSLKNSLINFLFFRSDRAGVRTAVYQALEQRAAADLSRVRMDTAVDHTRLIRIGYVLAAVFVLAGAYTILSPKSSFQAFARIVQPWADIEHPSRVRIEEVLPGNGRAFHGDSISVSARCYDLAEKDRVELVYSSLDGYLNRQRLAMAVQEGGLLFTASLPDSPDGIQQDLIYWVEAGDARSGAYRIAVEPAPSIWVDQLEYVYPAYTGKSPRIVQRHGDIRAVEGTRVIIRARSNVPIAAAAVELDPLSSNLQPDGKPASDKHGPSPMVEMKFEDQRAWCELSLEMNSARDAAKHPTYQLKLVTQAGDRNPQPAIHRIEVIPDLPPEIEILTPTTDRVEMPLDGVQAIEVRAIDPDFGIRRIRLRAASGGQSLLDAVLMEEPEGRTGQVVVRYDFRPLDHQLAVGEEIVFWAVAEDNRHSADGVALDANTAKTRNYRIVLLPPRQRPTTADDPPPEDTQQDPSQPSDTGAKPNDPSGPEEASSGSGPSKDEPEDPSEDADSGDQDGGPAGQQASSTGEGSGDDAQQAEGQPGGEGPETNAGGDSRSGSQSVEGNPGESSQDSPSSGGTGSSASQGSSSSDGGENGGSGQPNGPLHDGEVFERAMEHMEQARDGANARPADEPSSADAASAEATSDSSAKGSPSAGKSPPPGSSGTSGDPSGQSRPSDSVDAGGDAPAGEPPADQQAKPPVGANQPDERQGEGKPQEGSPGAGGQPQGPMETQPSDSAAAPQQDSPKQPGQGDQGDAGAGQASDKKQGSATASKENQDRPKDGAADTRPPESGVEPQAPSQSRKQSNSQGEGQGDQSGGGKKGAGQSGNQAGNDSAGSNSAADEGAGAAQESGAGETAERPGEGQPTSKSTGAPGSQKGPGSGAKPATDPADAIGGSGSSGPQSDGPTGAGKESGNRSEKPQGQGVPSGGGQPGSGDLSGSDDGQVVPPGEAPNLEYTRKATDLVLEYLKDQQARPDRELLDKLGWTANDLQKFIERWETLKRSATENTNAQRDLTDSLRSLGLRPPGGQTRNVRTIDDAARTARNAGTQSNPPPQYSEQFRAFLRGTLRTSDE